MGIVGLWEVIGKGEVHRIEDYAAAHWEKHTRPLRIAVDKPSWRFSNLTDEQVQRIQEGEPAANPIEKVILWRILKFWRLNIQLLFVTDGLRRIAKDRWASKGSGRRGGKVDPKCIKMLHQMFDRLKVPYHSAPGEAEAECARLQLEGVVDVVWSDDSDCLMFGCTKLIKAHRDSSGKKEWLDRIAVYDAETVLPKYDLDTDSLVMFAVLSGGDYDTKGLPGCGHQTARGLCKVQRGLAKELKRCTNEQDLMRWRDMLATALAAKRSLISVPPDFPSLKAVNGYRHPAVSTSDQCKNLRRLNGGWEWQERRMDQTALRVVLRDHYNFKTKEWMHYMALAFLARMLTRDVTPDRRQENLSYGIQLRRTLKRKVTADDDGTKAEVNILFNAALLVDIDLSFQDSVNADGTPYDPTEPVKGVMLKCFLEHGLPEGALDKPAPSPKKRGKKSAQSIEVIDVDDDSTTPSASQSAPTCTQQSSGASRARKQPNAMEKVAAETEAQPVKPAKKRARKDDDQTGTSRPAKKPRKLKASTKARSASPPPATFRRVAMPDFDMLRRSASQVIDLGEDGSEDDLPPPRSPGLFVSPYRQPATSSARTARNPTAGLGLEIRTDDPRIAHGVHELSSSATLQTNKTFRPQTTNHVVDTKNMLDMSKTNAQSLPERTSMAKSNTPLEELIPGEVAVAATLRQRRELGLLSKLPMRSREADPETKPVQQPQCEVIDLT